jgi:hypothetical protein
MKYKIIVPWHNPAQIQAFKDAWSINGEEDYLVLQYDENREGCAVTKNRGVERAIQKGAKTVIILDDDCFPESIDRLPELAEAHLECLHPVQVEMFQRVTEPISRGTPYQGRHVEMPVACSMGFWTNIGDYDALGQLVHGATKQMVFRRKPVVGKYFALCGMNMAVDVKWWPWFKFINVSRFDDIWMGFIFQKHAYSRGHCFNLNGPLVRHSRQSNVWANLRDESKYLEKNETLWQDIAHSKFKTRDELLTLLPDGLT